MLLKLLDRLRQRKTHFAATYEREKWRLSVDRQTDARALIHLHVDSSCSSISAKTLQQNHQRLHILPRTRTKADPEFVGGDNVV